MITLPSSGLQVLTECNINSLTFMDSYFLLILNGMLGKKSAPVITNKFGRYRAVRYNRVWLYYIVQYNNVSSSDLTFKKYFFQNNSKFYDKTFNCDPSISSCMTQSCFSVKLLITNPCLLHSQAKFLPQTKTIL